MNFFENLNFQNSFIFFKCVQLEKKDLEWYLTYGGLSKFSLDNSLSINYSGDWKGIGFFNLANVLNQGGTLHIAFAIA